MISYTHKHTGLKCLNPILLVHIFTSYQPIMKDPQNIHILVQLINEVILLMAMDYK